MTQAGRYLTAPQAAEMLEVSDQTVRDWVRAGKLPAITLPSGQVRIPREHIEAILAGDRLGAA